MTRYPLTQNSSFILVIHLEKSDFNLKSKHRWFMWTDTYKLNLNPWTTFLCFLKPKHLQKNSFLEIVWHPLILQLKAMIKIWKSKSITYISNIIFLIWFIHPILLPCQPKCLPLITTLVNQIYSTYFYISYLITSTTINPLGSKKYDPTESKRILVSMLTWIFIAKNKIQLTCVNMNNVMNDLLQ